MKNRFRMNNVYRATYGINERYGDENRYPKELEKALEPYVVNGYLKQTLNL